MGTWDTGSFDNDTAADWSYSLEKSNDLSIIEVAFDRVLGTSASTGVPADVGEEAVAAADTLVRLLGRHRESNSYTESVDAWVRAHPLAPTPELLAKARAALARITTAPSELLELWNESDDAGGWVDEVNELAALLNVDANR